MIALLRPKAVMPVHGEFRMLAAHAQLAREGGVPEDRIVLAENGSVVELRDGVARIVDEVEAGVTFVDGLGVGDVHDAINRLAKIGAEVLHEDNAPVHVSGHACAEELRTIIGLLRPKSVMPVHGEFRMLAAHAQLAREGGVPDDRIVLAENGSVVELRDGVPQIVDEVEAGMTFVDGLGVGDVHDVALRDRRRLAEDGVLIVVATLAAQDGGGLTAPPELIVRGFGEGAEPLLDELREEANRVLRELLADDVTEIKLLQEHLHDALGGVVYDRTRRRPMVLPVIVEV